MQNKRKRRWIAKEKEIVEHHHQQQPYKRTCWPRALATRNIFSITAKPRTHTYHNGNKTMAVLTLPYLLYVRVFHHYNRAQCR